MLLDKPKLTKFRSRVGRRKCLLCHAPVEDVAVAIIRGEDRCEVPERNGVGWRAGEPPRAEGSPGTLPCSAQDGRSSCCLSCASESSRKERLGRCSALFFQSSPLWKPAGRLLEGCEEEGRESCLTGAALAFVACEEEMIPGVYLSPYTFKRMWPWPNPFCFCL